MPDNVIRLIENFKNVILDPIIGLLFGLAIVVFLWGIVKFVWKSDNEIERKTGQQHMLWGIIGIFIMVSVVAIINIFLSTLSIPTI